MQSSRSLQEGCGYEEIVVQLETRFAGLRPPEQARDLCHQQRMKKDETIEEFGARVRQLATLTTRESPRKQDELREMSTGCFINGLLPDIQLQVRAQIRMRKHLGELDMNFFDLQQLAHNMKEQQELDEQRVDKNKKTPVIESVYAVEEESDDTDNDEEVEVYYTEEQRKNWKNRRMNASHVATICWERVV